MNYDFEDKAQQSVIRQIVEDVGMCGCGSVGKWELIHMILDRAGSGESRKSLYEPIADDCGSRPTELIAHLMDGGRMALLDHGTSIGGSWLSDRGKALLAFFSLYGDHDENWPEWVWIFDGEEPKRSARDSGHRAFGMMLEALEAFVTAHERCLQLEKTDVALRMAKAAIAVAKGQG